MNIIEGFKMEPYVRIFWASDKARLEYEDKLYKAEKLYEELELLSYGINGRVLATKSVGDYQMEGFRKSIEARGLETRIIDRVRMYTGAGFRHEPPVEGEEALNFMAVYRKGEEHYAQEFIDAERRGDHGKMGELLGFPKCCSEAMKTDWVKYFDTTWQQALKTNEAYIKEKDLENRYIKIKGLPFFHNMMLRPNVVGPIFHTKCKHDCELTGEIAKQKLAIAK
ncbi:MAG: hypothetical protein ACRC5C_07135, partial [Bacilli bacterium]